MKIGSQIYYHSVLYHYYGIAVKENSQYYDVMYSKKGAAWVNETGKKEVTKQTVAYSPRSKLGTLLPEFPNVKDLNLPASLPEEKVSTFIMMYRTHCQRILDTVIRANFDEVQSFLLHFWQGMPPHMLPVLGSSTVVNIVGVCDSILYKAISGVLMPTVLQALPDSLTQVIRKFAKQLDEWLKVALHDLPENLRNIKFELSRRFSQILRRQTSLNHLCQASRTVIHSADITFQMLEDWRNVDLNSITKQTLYTMEDSREEHRKLIIQCKNTQEVTTMVAIATSIPIQCRVSIHPYHMILLFLDHFTTQLTTEALHRDIPPTWHLLWFIYWKFIQVY
uniref:Regulatory factor X4 n=1 Tax=Otus sunia TaxID=257818 RepID=A0A8C8B8X8_9STRI